MRLVGWVVAVLVAGGNVYGGETRVRLVEVKPGNEDGTPIVYVFERTGELNEKLELEYVVTGSAIPFHDYLPGSGKLVFEAGSAQGRVVLESLDDDFAEAGKTTSVFLRKREGVEPGAGLEWEEPEALRGDVLRKLEKLDPLVRRQMGVLTSVGPVRLAGMLGFSHAGGTIQARVSLPENIKRDAQRWLDRGMEVVIETTDWEGIWTLRKQMMGDKGYWNLTRYLAAGESGSAFPRLEVMVEMKSGEVSLFALLPSPRPGRTQRLEIGNQRSIGLPHAEVSCSLKAGVGQECRFPGLADASFALAGGEGLEPQHVVCFHRVVYPALVAIGAVDPGGVTRAFPEFGAAWEDIAAGRALLEREGVTPNTVATLGEIQGLNWLVGRKMLEGEKLEVAKKILDNAGWVKVASEDIAWRSEQVLRAMVEYPDLRIRNAGRLLLEDRGIRVFDPGVPVRGIEGPCVPGEER